MNAQLIDGYPCTPGISSGGCAQPKVFGVAALALPAIRTCDNPGRTPGR